MKRDTAERGRSVESVLKQYNLFVKHSFDNFVKPVLRASTSYRLPLQTIRRADLVIPNGRYNEKGTTCILNNIISMMAERGILTKEDAQQISKTPLTGDSILIR